MVVSKIGLQAVDDFFWRFHHLGTKNRGKHSPPKMDGEKIMENPTKMDDLGIPLFLETPISR